MQYLKLFGHLSQVILNLYDNLELDNHLTAFAEEGHMMSAYIKAIRKLANNNNDYDIVLRPHPNENIKTWKICLEDIPNVHVIQEGSISAWVNHAFAVVHNGCTTALEATISEKPVVTYVPFRQKYSRELANELGHRVDAGFGRIRQRIASHFTVLGRLPALGHRRSDSF